MKFLIGTMQVALLTVIYWLGNLVTKYTHLPLPGSIVGLVILFLLLQLKIIRVEWIERGANWMLAELLLFFIPAAVGVINYQQVIGSHLVKLVAVIFLSTITVMAFTGVTAQFIAKRGEGGIRASSTKSR